MNNTFLKTSVAAVLAGAAFAPVSVYAMDILARVISSTPVVQQVSVPRQVCNNEIVAVQGQRSGGGALLGAIAGGAAGNAIGSGGGRAAATMIGLLGGAVLGDRIEAPSNQYQNVQQCSTQTYYENRTALFNVVYEYQGAQYSAQMPTDPGMYLRLQVTPVGAVPAGANAPQANNTPQQGYYQQPASIVQETVYVQQPVAPVYYAQPYPQQYSPRPYYAPGYAPSYVQGYAPAIAPIGLSINLGYSRGFGGRHWR